MASQEATEIEKTTRFIQNLKEETKAEESHYKEMLKLKDERLTKLNEKVKSLESENERIKSKVLDLEEENEKIRKKYAESELSKINAEIMYENEKKKNEDLKDFYGKWKDIDLTEFINDRQMIDEEMIKKRLHYNTVQITLDKENIDSLQESIGSLETRLRLQESLTNKTTNLEANIFDRLFGKDKLKMEIQRLTTENRAINYKLEELMSRIRGLSKIKTILEYEYQLLRDKETNISKLIKVHKFQCEEQLHQLEEAQHNHPNLKTNPKTEADPQMVQELALVKFEIQKKDVSIEEMKQQIDELLDENKRMKNELNSTRGESKTSLSDETSSINTIKNQLNIKCLEYDQLEMKYLNARESLNVFQNQIDLPKELISEDFSNEDRIFESNMESTSSPPTQLVCNQDIQVTNCPCCDESIPISDIEEHLEVCLAEQI